MHLINVYCSKKRVPMPPQVAFLKATLSATGTISSARSVLANILQRNSNLTGVAREKLKRVIECACENVCYILE